MAAQNVLEDGTFDWSLGQDAWHHPDRIQPNQYASGVNVLSVGGGLGPRPPFLFKKLVFPDQTIEVSPQHFRLIGDIFRSGKFQLAVPYNSGSDRYILFVISGLIFRARVKGESNFPVVLLSETIKLDQFRPRINWSYADGKVVLFDWPDYPVVIDQNEVFRCSDTHTVNGAPAPQVPVSFNGTYNQNRLFVCNLGVEFTAGDVVGNLLTPEAPITFTEVYTPSSPFVNQFFALPTEDASYPITAMGFIQQQDTSTGIGPLFIANQRRVYYYPVNQPRSAWTQGAFGTVLLDNAGIVGPRAFVNVNSDVVFLSTDGNLHALSTARNNSRQWGNVPISREVYNFLKYWDKDLAQYAVLGYHKNKIYISANPYRMQALTTKEEPVSDYAHGGFCVLDIESMASFLSEGTPVWTGLWTGVNPMEIFTIDDRCFVVSKDGGQNVLYEIGDVQTTPDITPEGERDISSIIYTKSYSTEAQYAHKRQGTTNVHLLDIGGRLKMTLEKQPSHSYIWQKFAEWEHEAPQELCYKMPPDMLINGISPHKFRELVFGDASDPRECNIITSELYEVFRQVQHRIRILGSRWTIENYKIQFHLMAFAEKQDLALCNQLPITRIPLQCSPDWLIPEVIKCL